MRTASIYLAALLAAVSPAGESDPSTVNPELFTVASTGFHRFLEFRVCSPEHCWSQAYLQWREDQKILATKELSEIGYGRAVESASWKWEGETPRLELRIVPSHGGFEPYTLIITPRARGEYTASKQDH